MPLLASTPTTITWTQEMEPAITTRRLWFHLTKELKNLDQGICLPLTEGDEKFYSLEGMGILIGPSMGTLGRIGTVTSAKYSMNTGGDGRYHAEFELDDDSSFWIDSRCQFSTLKLSDPEFFDKLQAVIDDVILHENQIGLSIKE